MPEASPSQSERAPYARRDRFVAAVANAVLRLASKRYQAMIKGSIVYGLNAAARDAVPAVTDDAVHIRNPLAVDLTLCEQRIAADTNIGTYSDLLANPGGSCWTCEDVAGSARRA